MYSLAIKIHPSLACSHPHSPTDPLPNYLSYWSIQTILEHMRSHRLVSPVTPAGTKVAQCFCRLRAFCMSQSEDNDSWSYFDEKQLLRIGSREFMK